MRVVLFLLDAFKEEYVSKKNTPFLFKKAKEGFHVKKIIPSGGFCERAEIFFGLKPSQSGFFTALGFDSNNGIYNKRRGLNLFGKIEQIAWRITYLISKTNKNKYDSLIQKILCKIYFRYFGSLGKLKPYKIPLSFLKYFNLTEDNTELHKRGVISGKESLFKIVENLGFKTYINAFTSLGETSTKNDKERINLAVEASKEEKNLFIPVYINITDSAGHLYGPNSMELKAKINELDKTIEENVNILLGEDPKTTFVFLGDHGMTEIKKNIDVKMQIVNISKKYGLKMEKDFVFFLDSTLVRMWFFNDKARIIFEREFKTNQFFNENGIIIDQEMACKYDLPINERKYGDISWWANEGVLIFPDFFRTKKPAKGMHGYRPDSQSTYGTCVFWGKGIKKQEIETLELYRIYNLIKKRLLI